MKPISAAELEALRTKRGGYTDATIARLGLEKKAGWHKAALRLAAEGRLYLGPDVQTFKPRARWERPYAPIPTRDEIDGTVCPFATVADFWDFVLNLRQVSVKGIEEAKREIEFAREEAISGDERHWRAEEIYHRGMLAACEMIEKGSIRRLRGSLRDFWKQRSHD